MSKIFTKAVIYEVSELNIHYWLSGSDVWLIEESMKHFTLDTASSCLTFWLEYSTGDTGCQSSECSRNNRNETKEHTLKNTSLLRPGTVLSAISLGINDTQLKSLFWQKGKQFFAVPSLSLSLSLSLHINKLFTITISAAICCFSLVFFFFTILFFPPIYLKMKVYEVDYSVTICTTVPVL